MFRLTSAKLQALPQCPAALLNSGLEKRLLNMAFLVKNQKRYLLPLDFFGGQHGIDANVEGLAPQFAVSALGVSGGHVPGPRPRAEQVGATVAAETDGTLQSQTRTGFSATTLWQYTGF